MRHYVWIALALAAQLATSDAWAQGRGNCSKGGGPETARRMAGGLSSETSGAALFNLANSTELAGRRTISPAYQMQQQYLQEQYLAYQRQLEHDRATTQEKSAAKARKLEAIKERRLAADARREAAKAKRLQSQESASVLKTASTN
jgi:hypothetical protein